MSDTDPVCADCGEPWPDWANDCPTCHAAFVDSPATRAAAEKVRDVYQHSGAGGGLHIVLDDGNVEDGHLDWCAEHLTDFNDLACPMRLAAERACIDAFRPLTENERRSAISIAERNGWM